MLAHCCVALLWLRSVKPPKNPQRYFEELKKPPSHHTSCRGVAFMPASSQAFGVRIGELQIALGLQVLTVQCWEAERGRKALLFGWHKHGTLHQNLDSSSMQLPLILFVPSQPRYFKRQRPKVQSEGTFSMTTTTTACLKRARERKERITKKSESNRSEPNPCLVQQLPKRRSPQQRRGHLRKQSSAVGNSHYTTLPICGSHHVLKKKDDESHACCPESNPVVNDCPRTSSRGNPGNRTRSRILQTQLPAQCKMFRCTRSCACPHTIARN
ncbi:hypothetical protein VTI74DRAFT_6072 [Chaetomium olivicolor]